MRVPPMPSAGPTLAGQASPHTMGSQPATSGPGTGMTAASDAPTPGAPGPDAPVTVRRVAVALDFADPSRHAAEWVAARFPEAELVLVHAVDVPVPPAFLAPSLTGHAELVEDSRRGAEVRLRELAHDLAPAHIWPEVRVGTPVKEIADVVHAYAPDLLVVGPHGARAESGTDGELGRERPLGSTAGRLARVACAPVLLARGLPDGPPRRVLAAIDDSSRTARVLAWARMLVERFGSEVVLLHALDPALAGAAGGTALMDALREATSSWLERRVAELGGDRDVAPAAVSAAVAVGEPAAEIVAAARRAAADLVVIGSRRTEDERRALTGRTTDRLLRLGGGPLLIVPEAV